MNYLRACRRQSDGRWDFTLQNDGAVYAIGYCRGEPGLSKPGFTHKYHEDGHATAEEAAQCYHDYQLDQLLRLIDPEEKPRTLYQCAAPDCVNFTAGYAECEHWHAWLCDSHRNVDTVRVLMPVSTEIWRS